MGSEAKARANARYNAANTRQVALRLNTHTDADVLERLDSLKGESKMGYIKRLIREDMEREGIG